MKRKTSVGAAGLRTDMNTGPPKYEAAAAAAAVVVVVVVVLSTRQTFADYRTPGTKRH
jgi:hypothetical protein